VRLLNTLIPEVLHGALVQSTRQYCLERSKLDHDRKKLQLTPSCCSLAGQQGTKSAIKWLKINNRKEGWQANGPLFFEIIRFVDTCLDAVILHALSMDLASASTKPPRISIIIIDDFVQESEIAK